MVDIFNEYKLFNSIGQNVIGGYPNSILVKKY